MVDIHIKGAGELPEVFGFLERFGIEILLDPEGNTDGCDALGDKGFFYIVDPIEPGLRYRIDFNFYEPFTL